MAIDPTNTTPADAATVQSLQSTTEASAKAAMRAPVVSSWAPRWGEFRDLFALLGDIISGVLDVGGQLLEGVVSGIVGFVGGLVNAIRRIFIPSGGSGPVPEPLPIFSPITMALEETLEPLMDDIDEALDQAEALGGQIATINGSMGIINGKITTINGNLTTLNTGLSNLNGDLTDLNDDLLAGLNPLNPQSPLWTIQGNINAVQANVNIEQGRINVEQGRINTLVSEFQQQQLEINDLTLERDAAQELAQRALKEALEATQQMIGRILFVPRSTPIENEHFLVTYTPGNAHKWRVTAKGTWIGQMTWQSVYNNSGAFDPAIDGFSVGGTGTRTWDLDGYNRHQSIISYHVLPGVGEEWEQQAPNLSLSQDSWDTFMTFTVNDAANYLIYFRSGWANANHADSFGVRVVRVRAGTTTEIVKKGPQVNLGPLFGNGYRTQTVTKQDVPLLSGDIIRFQGWAGGPNPVNRQVTNSWAKLSWIRQPEDEDNEP